MRHPFRKTFRQIWWAPLVCFGLAALLNEWDMVRQFEWRTLDWRTRYRANFQPSPDPRLRLVVFDDDSEENLVAWPPSRQWHGNLIELLSVAGARVVTMDVFITSERDPEGDQAMAAGIEAARERGTEAVTGAVRSDFPTEATESTAPSLTVPISQVEGDVSRLIASPHMAPPIPVLRKVSHYGFVDMPKLGSERVVDSAGIPRTPPMVVKIGADIYPSLSLATLMRYFRVPANRVRVVLGEAIYVPTEKRLFRIPIDARGCLLLNYRYEALDADSVFPTDGYRKLFLGLYAKYVRPDPATPPPPDLKDTITMIGLFETGNADAAPSPRAEFSPLPLVHLNVLNNILTDDYARKAPAWLLWGIAIALGYASLLLLSDRSVTLLMGGTVLSVVGYLAFGLWAWVFKSWWLELIAPIFGFVVLQFVMIGRRIVAEQKAKQEIKGMFGSYVSPQLVDQLVKSGEMPQLGGHAEELTAYFSDIQGFSTFSEQLPPDRLVELMNEYLTACTDLLQEEGGTLDKYIGDAVVAMFGAPIALPGHPHRACVAALRVQRRLGELREKWRGEGNKWPGIVGEMRSRIGLNTGRCVVGNMGSRTRFNYTMMGDDVNLAARMESGAKSWGVYVMCTEATRLACEAQVPGRIVFRPLGRIVVKGRAQAVPIHEVVELAEHVSDRTRECIALFTEGLQRYHAQDWEGAADYFRRSASLEPNVPECSPGVLTNPSKVFSRIVAEYRSEPPPGTWNGVYIMKEK